MSKQLFVNPSVASMLDKIEEMFSAMIDSVKSINRHFLISVDKNSDLLN